MALSFRNKNKITVTKDSLDAAIRHSYVFCDKWGRHSDELGRQMSEIANIVIKLQTDRSISDYRLETLRSDILYVIFRELSSDKDKSNGKKCFRDQFEAGEIDNTFNYFTQVAKFAMYNVFRIEKTLQETEEQFQQIFSDAFYASMRAEGEDNCMDIGDMCGLDYNGSNNWYDNY